MWQDAFPDIKRNVPKISWDMGKCPTPMACKKCLEICPQAVFMLVTLKNKKYVETDINDPNAYLIHPLFRDKCVGCNDCVGVCPSGAINIVFEGEGN
ncbi:MAG: ATP-binding protein [Bacillota bacterium]